MSLILAADPVPLRMDVDGLVRIGDTRVTLDTLVTAFQQGTTADTLVEQYQSLQLADVHTALGYYLRHQAEIDEYLQQRRHQAAQVRQENEAWCNPIGVRDRLLARRKAQG